MKTVFYHSSDQRWHVIDAGGVVLGKAAALAASLLRGKYNANYTPHVPMGDFVIVTNAEKAVVTGTKRNDKMYRRHSGYLGSLKSESYGKLLSRKPTSPMEKAIKGMLPKNKLGRELFRRLHVYAGDAHRHEAQKPVSRNNLLKEVQA